MDMFSEFRRKVTVKSETKCDEIPSHIELDLSTSESTKNQFRFNQL